MDRLDAYRLFVRAAETGVISGAAREMGLTQPAASRLLGALETQLGARLFARSTRSLTLTEAGHLALDRARALLAELDGLETTVRGLDRIPTGLLRVAGSVAFGRSRLIPRTADFLRAWPLMRVEYVLKDERIDPVVDAVDLTFRLGPMEDSRLTARRLGAYDRRLAASPDFVARHGQAVTPHDLNDCRTLDFTGLSYGRRWPLSDGRRMVQVEIKGESRANSGEAVLDLALQGLGVALLPSFLVDPLIADGRLVRVLPGWSGPPLELHAVWAARELPRKARAYLDFIVQTLSVDR
ncbi:MAG: LysR family transcriptional regulator [Caulobacter sp.]|nr:LysR family transcriptional regulator [Caulobacter sp.]